MAKLDFKSTIKKLSFVKTTINTINEVIKFETVAKVDESLQRLFSKSI